MPWDKEQEGQRQKRWEKILAEVERGRAPLAPVAASPVLIQEFRDGTVWRVIERALVEYLVSLRTDLEKADGEFFQERFIATQAECAAIRFLLDLPDDLAAAPEIPEDEENNDG